MSKKKSADKNKKSSVKKSPADQSHKPIKSADKTKPKSGDQATEAKKSVTKNTSAGSTGKANKPTSKDNVPVKTTSKDNKKSQTDHKPNASTSKAVLSAHSATSTVQLEKYRKRLFQLDTEHRAMLEEETKKCEHLEAEQTEKIRQQNQTELEKKVKQLQEEYHHKLNSTNVDFAKQQQEEITQLDCQELKSNKTTEKKRVELVKEMETRKEETRADIERYRTKRLAEKDEQVKRIEQQCEADIAEYTNKRVESNDQLEEQFKQKIELEIKNDKQKSQLKTSHEKDKVKERIQKAQAEETAKVNDQMAQATTKLRAQSDADLGEALADHKKTLQKELEKTRARIDEEFCKERAKLDKLIESVEDAIKGKLKQHQRELEGRTKMKQELLALLNMPDTVKLADEEMIASRHHFKIERNQIIVQSDASTIYKAKKDEFSDTFYCKVTMLDKWSTRHRADFARHSTRLVRYLTANHNKAPFFTKVIEVLATDSKLYTLVEPLPSSHTLVSYVTGKKAKTDFSLKKAELVNVLNQVTKGIRFLNGIFVAHANLSPDNITLLLGPNTNDLSECKLVLTGLTRPIVFYNVESDQYTTTKGFDLSSDGGDSIDHLPAECFESEFGAVKLDAYSIGVLAYMMAQLRSPFGKCGSSRKKILATKQAEPVKLESNASEYAQLASLVASLTVPQPDKRTSLEDILKHAFFHK